MDKFFTYVRLFSLTILIVVFLPGLAGYIETHYTLDAIAVATDTHTTIIFEDETVHLWAVKNRGYAIGDKVKLTFDTSYTDDTRIDDKITKIENNQPVHKKYDPYIIKIMKNGFSGV